MMRPIYITLTALAIVLLPGICFGDDYEDCKLNCQGERDTRNMDCPSPYDVSEETRRQCLNDSQADYQTCLGDCPPPSPSEEQGSPQLPQTGIEASGKTSSLTPHM